MKNSKLLVLLQSFSAAELREFRDFVASPYFNKNQELLLFYDHLKQLAPRFPDRKIERKAVYQSLFPGKKYDDKHFKYLMSFLLKLAEQFIGQKEYEGEAMLRQYHMLESCVKRQLPKSYKNIFGKTVNQLAQSPYRDTDHYFHQYLMAEVSGKYFASQQVRKVSDELQSASDHLDLFYLSKKLRFTCEMLNAQKILSAGYQQNLIDEISLYLQKSKHDEVPAISIYYQIFLLLTKGSADEYFEKMETLLERHFHEFPPSEMKQFYLHAINFCIRRTRQNEEEDRYVAKALQFYQKGIEENLLLEDGVLSPWTFKNVIKLGLRLKRFEWVEEFISQYAKRLPDKVRANAVNYGRADMSYYRGDFEQAMSHLRQVEFTDIFFATDAKVMLLKLYYDNDETEALYSLIHSFRIFLRRNKLVSDDIRRAYLNFIRFLGQVLRAGGGRKLFSIREKVVAASPLPARKWLLEVIDARLE